MFKFLVGSFAYALAMGGGAVLALPATPFFATAEMVATVSSVSVDGDLLDLNGNYVRDLTLADTPLLPWNVGDRLTVRWEQDSRNLVDCTPSDIGFSFGGISVPTAGNYSGSCFSPDAASFVRLDRALGGISPVWDGWEGMIGVGPFFNVEAGELERYFAPIDGLVTDCCVYLYDPAADEVITLEAHGGANPEQPSWPVQSLWYSIFDGPSGEGGMVLYSSEMFGLSEWEDPETGEVIPLGFLETGSFGVHFDVEWRSTLQSIAQVPEPTSATLIGLGLLCAAGFRRQRAKQQGAGK